MTPQKLWVENKLQPQGRGLYLTSNSKINYTTLNSALCHCLSQRLLTMEIMQNSKYGYISIFCSILRLQALGP